MSRTAGQDVATNQLLPSVRSSGYKRLFDLLVLVAAHVALAPILLILWAVVPLLIWLEDRGPVFYSQQRPGKGGRLFTVRKFRTMIVDADQLGPAWKTDDDPRVTRVGRLLRRTAMDELPGVLSIWKGDMSLVGPRALPIEEQKLLEEQIPGFDERLQIRPGLTGLAQVYNDDDEALAKLHFDREYMRSMNPLLDAKLLFLSIANTLLARWDTRVGKHAIKRADHP